jgi:hypothetical protein
MLIIESKKAIFVHIEKCGGSAIESALDPFLEIYDVRVGGTPFGEEVQPFFRKKFGLHKHSKGREIRRVLSPEKYSKYFSFAFVRNPLSRVISSYRYLRSGTWNPEIALRVQKMDSIKEFVLSDDLKWVVPCHSYIFDAKGNQCVDFIGKVENMDLDFAWVCGRLGVPPIKLPKANVSSSSDDPVELKAQLLSDDDCLKIIKTRFEVDFESFGYA